MSDPRDQMPEPPDDSMLAAEYALGVLDADERAIFERRLGHDAALRREVSAWEARLAGMLGDVEPATVPAYLWPRIRRGLGLLPWRRDDVPEVHARPGLWDSVGFWRGLSGGAIAAAAISIAVLVLQPRPQPTPSAPPPVVVAPSPQPMAVAMADDAGTAVFTASIDLGTGTMLVQPLAVSLPAGRVPELWLIPPDGKPRSLGVLDPGHAHVVALPAALRDAFGPQSVMAVTDEPPGGAPGGIPTGQVIAKGAIVRI